MRLKIFLISLVKKKLKNNMQWENAQPWNKGKKKQSVAWIKMLN